MNEPQANPHVAINNAQEEARQRLEAEIERFKNRHNGVLSTASVVAPSHTLLSELPKAVERMKETRPPVSESEMRLWTWQNTIVPNLHGSRLPVRFHSSKSHQMHPKQRRVYELCKDILEQRGAIIALIGERGVGKTTIAAQLILDRAWNEDLEPWKRRPPYRKMTDLIAMFKPLYADFGSIKTDDLMERRNGFCSLHPLVIIDELHECEDQKLKDRVLTDILDRRYANMNDTLLISNQTPAEFKSTTNDSILSRLSEHGRIIECRWNSFREKAA